MSHMDASLAQAEAALERLDDARNSEERPPPSPYAGSEDFTPGEGFHVEEEGAEVPNVDEEHVFDGVGAVLDAFNEVFNARDMEGVLEILAPDAELPGLAGDAEEAEGALEHLWGRRPSCTLTRGELDGRSVAVLWEVGDDGQWQRIAPVWVEVDDDDRLAVVEFDEDAEACHSITTEEPEAEFEPGTTWAEWTDGVPAD